MLCYILLLCFVHLSRQGNEGWHPVGGEPVFGTDGIDHSHDGDAIEPPSLDDGDVVASGWYPADQEALYKYKWVDVADDADGFRLLNDSNLLNYTFHYHYVLVFHFHSKNPKERTQLTAVKKIFKSLQSTQFESGTPNFGSNSPSIKMQQQLNMTKVPCLAYHKNDAEVVYYKGKLERQGILEFMASLLGKVEDDEGVPLTQEKGVFVVNKGNYKNFINGPIFAMIYYYAEGCTACSATFPAFENLMTKYNYTDDQVWLGQYKTSKIEALLQYNITSLPAITYGMMGGKRWLYTQSFDQFSIEMFITTQMVFDESQYAIQLNADRFYSFIKLKPVVIVKFLQAGDDKGYPQPKIFAAWSVMAQKWEHPVVFATINTTEHKLRETEMNEGIGTVMYKWGKMYTIPFTYKTTLDYQLINLISDKISREVKDEGIRDMRDTQVEDTILLGVFPGKSDTSAIFQHYEQTVLSHEDRQELVVLHSFDKATAARFKVSSPSMVLLYPAESVTIDKATPNYMVVPISTTQPTLVLANKILELCQNSTHFPLIASTDYTGLSFHNPDYTKHLVTIYLPLDWGADNWSNMNHWTQKVKPLAIEYKKKGLIFVYADEETNYDSIQELGIREGTISELIFTITNNELQRVFYPKAEEYEGPFIEVLKGFIDKYLGGELAPKIRSQKEVVMSPGKLATVVGSNAEQFMVPTDHTLAVTLLYKEHSQEVLNTQLLMELLAEKYAHIKTLRFGKLELARNDLFFKAPITNWLMFSNQYKKRVYYNMMDKCAGSLIDFEACITMLHEGELSPSDDISISDEMAPELEEVADADVVMPVDDLAEPQLRTETEENEPEAPLIINTAGSSQVTTGYEEMPKDEPELIQQGEVTTGYEEMPKDEPELIQQGEVTTGSGEMPKDEPELIQQGEVTTGSGEPPKIEPEAQRIEPVGFTSGDNEIPSDEAKGIAIEQVSTEWKTNEEPVKSGDPKDEL